MAPLFMFDVSSLEPHIAEELVRRWNAFSELETELAVEPGRRLSVAEAARALGIRPNTLRTLTDTGRIPCERNEVNFRVYDPAVIIAEKVRRANTKAPPNRK